MSAPAITRQLALFRAGRKLARCNSGLALTEFAYSLPILLGLSLYGFETANLAIAHLRVSNIAMSAADNAARVREKIDEANVIDLLAGAKGTGTSIGFGDRGRIILSSFERDDASGRQWIRWQRCDGLLDVNSNYGRPKNKTNGDIIDGTEIYVADRTTLSNENQRSDPTHSTLTAVGPAGRQISAAPGTSILVAEVVYNYRPIVSESLFGPIQIRYESAFNVRQRTDQRLYNGGRVTPRSCNTRQA